VYVKSGSEVVVGAMGERRMQKSEQAECDSGAWRSWMLVGSITGQPPSYRRLHSLDKALAHTSKPFPQFRQNQRYHPFPLTSP